MQTVHTTNLIPCMSPPFPPRPQPFVYGLDDPKRTRLTASLFNGRKICGVFTPGARLLAAGLAASASRDCVPWLQGLRSPSRPLAPLHPSTPARLLRVSAGPGGEEVPAVWVDRTGAKIGITEHYSRQSKGSLALVAQVRRGWGRGAECSGACRAQAAARAAVQAGLPCALARLPLGSPARAGRPARCKPWRRA